MERLLERLGGLLCLATVTVEALVYLAITAPSGFGVFFCVSFGWGHRVLLDAAWVCGDCRLPKRT